MKPRSTDLSNNCRANLRAGSLPSTRSRNGKTAMLTALALAALISSGHAVDYTWTNGAVPEDGDWTNTANWDVNGVPVDNGGNQGLSLVYTDSIVLGTAALPTANIPTLGGRWAGNQDTPTILVNSGGAISLNLDNDGADAVVTNAAVTRTVLTVGDGTGGGTEDVTVNLTSPAGSVLLNRHTGGSTHNFTVNSDGTLIFSKGIDFTYSGATDRFASFTIAGGAVEVQGTVVDLTRLAGNFVNFTSLGGTFTANYGGDFADLPAVASKLGTDFLAGPGFALLATDNGASFTVSTFVPSCWDGTDTTADADGGDGTWNTTDLFWDDAPTAGNAIAWTNDGNAFFGGTGGTVTLGEPISVVGMTVDSSGYEITGNTLTFTSPSANIAVNEDCEISSGLGGSATVAKGGAGTLTLSGDGSGFTGDWINVAGATSLGSLDWSGTDFTLSAGSILLDEVGTVEVNDMEVGTATVAIASGSALDIGGILQFTDGKASLVSGAGELTASTGTLTLNSGTVNDGNLSTANQRIQTVIADDGGTAVTLVKNNKNQLMLSQPNTYTGGTTINGGRVQFDGSANLGTGDVTVNDGGQLYMTRNLSNNVTINGDGATEGAGTLGAIRFAKTTLTGNITVASAARIVAYGTEWGAIDGDLTGSGNLEVNIPDKNTNGTISLLGSGATYDGTLTVSRGRFNMGDALGGSVVVADIGTLGAEGAIAGDLTLGSTSTLTGGATLVVDPGSATPASCVNLTLNGVTTVTFDGGLPAAGSPAILIDYSGTLTDDGTVGDLSDNFSFSGTGFRTASFSDNTGDMQVELDLGTVANTWTGAGDSVWEVVGASTNWNNTTDSLFYNGDSASFGDGATSFNVVVDATNGTPEPYSISFTNTSGNDYLLTGGGIGGTGALTKTGDGEVTLANNNSYSGGTNIMAGTLVASDNANALGTGTTDIASGATLELYDPVNRSRKAATFTGTGTLLKTGGGVETFGAGTINVELGAGALIDVQNGAIESSSGHKGKWANNQASLNIASGANFRIKETPIVVDALTGSGSLSQNYASTGITIGIADGGGTFSGVIGGGGSTLNVEKVGTGTQTLAGLNTYTGNTTIGEGEITLADGGQLTMVPAATGVTNQITGVPAGTGAINLNGALFLNLGGADATVGNSWELVVDDVDKDMTVDLAVSYGGTFSVTSSLGAFTNNAGVWTLSHEVSEWTFTEATGTLTVGVSLYGTWADSFGLVGADALSTADVENGGTGDGLVNLLEYAFGTNPTETDNLALTVTSGTEFTPGTPIVDEEFSPLAVTMQYVRLKDYVAAGLTYTPLFSSDGENFIPDPSDPTPTVVSTQSEGDYEVVSVPFMLFLPGGEKADSLLGRVGVTMTP